jgi:hypothetical protein
MMTCIVNLKRRILEFWRRQQLHGGDPDESDDGTRPAGVMIVWCLSFEDTCLGQSKPIQKWLAKAESNDVDHDDLTEPMMEAVDDKFNEHKISVRATDEPQKVGSYDRSSTLAVQFRVSTDS